MKRQQLEKQALDNVCPCYYWQLNNVLSQAPETALQDIADDSYAMHDESIDPRADCPMWLQERAEWLGEMQMEMERGN